MKSVIIGHGQTLIDITMQELGDIARVFEVAALNGISATDSLTPGASILVPEYDQNKKRLVKMFEDPFNKPASSTGFVAPNDYWSFPVVEPVTLETFVPSDKKEVLVCEGQTLIDITMQELGDISRVFEVAELNGLAVTDTLMAGTYLVLPKQFNEDQREIVRTFSDPANKPASQRDQAEQVLPDGVAYWGIGLDFIVS